MSSLRERRLANRGDVGASGGTGRPGGSGGGKGPGGPGGSGGAGNSRGLPASGAWTSEVREGVVILRLSLPDKKQNVLTTGVMQELDVLLDNLPRDVEGHPLRGLILASGKEGSFIAGADIAEIDGIETNAIGRFKAADGQRILQKIAELPVPTVAAINGFCLGGGMELALACRYRVASLESRVLLGLPETRLGVLPGFGGTQRLPKLIGLRPALEMILAAKMVDTRKALKMGLVDRGVPPSLVVDAALELIGNPPPPARPRLGRMDRMLQSGLLSRVLFDKALEAAEEKAQGHYPAIPAVVELIRNTYFLPADAGGVSLEGLRLEAEAFGNLVVTDVSENLRALYFLDEDQKKFRPTSTEPAKTSRAAVLGAGIMGGGIAWAFSSRGTPVNVRDIRAEALLGALQSAQGVYKGDVKRRKLTERAADRAFSRIAVGLGWEGFRRADLIVEAVVERLDVKKAVLAELEPHVREDAVIASNTSGLSITEMAKSLEHPERFAGLHFFNPVHKMPLVEIIRGKQTSDATVATLWAAAKALGKTPILVRDAPGFLVNRVLIPYMLEAARMHEEGIAVPRIDGVATAFGMPMGPFELADAVGIDIGLHVAEHLERSFGARMSVPTTLGKMVEQKFLGQKSGKGFYIHEKTRASTRKKAPLKLNPVVAVKEKKGEGLENDVIRDRLFLTMLLEAGRCLEDEVVDRWEDVEIGMIFGTGFPPFRGGLIRWGASLGADDIEARCEPLAQQLGPRFAFPAVLRSLLGGR